MGWGCELIPGGAEGAGLGIKKDRGGVRIWTEAKDGDQVKFGKRAGSGVIMKIKGRDLQRKGIPPKLVRSILGSHTWDVGIERYLFKKGLTTNMQQIQNEHVKQRLYFSSLISDQPANMSPIWATRNAEMNLQRRESGLFHVVWREEGD